jgi:putative transposase
MPWKETDALSERAKFALEWKRRWEASEGDRVDMAELCRIFGISRQTGYLWVRRYEGSGFDLRALEDQSRKPLHNPRAVPIEMQDFIVRARKEFPKWGPVPLRQWLVERNPGHVIPSASTIAGILRRRGFAARRLARRARGTPVTVTPPFPECVAPNQTWSMDFKGWFKMGTGEKCYPFTLLDAFSRFLLRCEALLMPTGDAVRSILDSAFKEYGLPKAIRSDGGPPFFASKSPCALSKLSIWLLRLGITLECIAPAKPQQNGRLERFHRTLKRFVDPADDLPHQQRAFDGFRGEYNHERPHAALGLATPFSVHRKSPRRYPCKLLRPDEMVDDVTHVELVDKYGFLRWNRRRLFIGEAFAYERLQLWPSDDTRWEAYFGPICLGHFDANRLSDGFVPTRRPRHDTMRLSLVEHD